MNGHSLLGNETLKERLSGALTRNRLSHSYLITGPVGSGRHTLARLLMAAMECTASEKPCLSCPQCRKVLDAMHPDIITVDDGEKKTIPVRLVRDACADLFIRPNEGARKIYFFPRAQDLNPQGQNALLKCMEEPPAYGAFLLLAEHPEQLLPTIRSRCVELRLSPLPEALLSRELQKRFPDASPERIAFAVARSGGYLGQALRAMQEEEQILPQTAQLLQACQENSPLRLLAALVPMEKLKREQLRAVLLQCYRLFASALACHSARPPLRPESAALARVWTDSQLLSALELFQQALELTEVNVGTAHICGLLSVRLIPGNG